MTLEQLDNGLEATIIAVDWSLLEPGEGKRLRALGFDEGVRVSVVHRGVFGTRDPLAVSVGRMTIALRRVHARAMQVEPA